MSYAITSEIRPKGRVGVKLGDIVFVGELLPIQEPSRREREQQGEVQDASDVVVFHSAWLGYKWIAEAKIQIYTHDWINVYCQ